MPRRKLDRTRKNAAASKKAESDSDASKSSDEEEFASTNSESSSDESVAPRRTQKQRSPPRKSPQSRKKNKVTQHLEDSSSEEEEDYHESDDDEDDDDGSVHQRRTPNRKSTPKRIATSKFSSTRKNQKKTMELLENSSSEEEAEYQESDDEDESDILNHQRKTSVRAISRSKSPSTRKNGKNTTSPLEGSSSEEEEEYQESDEEDDESDASVHQRKTPKKNSTKPKSSSSSTRNKKKTEHVLANSSSDDDHADEDVAARKRSPRHKTGTRSTAVTPSQQTRQKQSPRTPPKSSAKGRKGGLSSSEKNASLKRKQSPPRSRRKQRRNSEDDEEFVPPNDNFSEESGDEEEEEEEDDGEDVWSDENESDDDDDDDESHHSDGSRVGRVGDIDEIGVANDSSEDEVTVKKPVGLGKIGIAEDSSDDEGAKKVSASSSRKVSHGQLDDSSDTSSDDTEIKPAARSHNCRPGCSPRALACTSKHDAITLENLPWPHVCFFPPEGERQCFALETLRQIALRAGHPEFRNDRVKEITQQTYMQPPHFRTAMSDELLDQIASRFSRDALDLQSPYHTRPLRPERPPNAEGEDDDDYDEEYYNPQASTSDVWEMMEKYLGRTMGSADLYVCPVCYRVAHKRALSSKHQKKSPGKLSDDQLNTMYTGHYTIDPMGVLGSIDHEEFKVASMFCFRKLPLLKQHLKEEHGLDTSVVEGNDLYKKYKIRATDGLLQTFLNSGQRSYSKSMQSYWFHGNNQDFVYLMSLVHNAEEVRNLGGYDSDNPAVQTLMDSGRDYFDSFSGIVDRLWNLTVDPFRKYDATVDDFIDDVGSDEEIVDDDDRNLHRTLFKDEDDDSRDADLQYARGLQDRYRNELDEYEEDDELSKGGDLVDSDEEEQSNTNANESSSSESEDEFDKKMRLKRGKIGRRVSSSASKRRRMSPKKKIITIHDDDSE